MYLNKLGQAARKCWDDIPKHYPVVEPDKYIIMPNHVHGIIKINNFGDNNLHFVGAQNFIPGVFANRQSPVGAQDFAPKTFTRAENLRPLPKDTCQHVIPKTLGSIIRGFKIGVTKRAR